MNARAVIFLVSLETAGFLPIGNISIYQYVLYICIKNFEIYLQGQGSGRGTLNIPLGPDLSIQGSPPVLHQRDNRDG
jgi:hypothetical protein